jgi:hypothetical protein
VGHAPISEILEGGVPMMAEIDTAILIGSISDIKELEYLKDIIDARIKYLKECTASAVLTAALEEE